MNNLIEIIIDEHIQPYVRMTQRSKFVDQAAMHYIHNQRVIKFYMQQQLPANNFTIYESTPLGCDLSFNLTQIHKADLDNLIKAALDAGTGIIYTSDAWIDSISARRRLSNTPKMIMQVWTL